MTLQEVQMRNQKIFKSVINGATLKEAGTVAGLSTERTRQIFNKMFRMMLNPKRMKNDKLPPNSFSLKDLRKFPDFWLNQLEKLKLEQSEFAKFIDSSL
jgi:hypothetical protein